MNANINIVVMSVMAAGLFAVVWATRGLGRAGAGVKDGVSLLADIWPLLLLALAVAGLIQALVPPERVRQYLGAQNPYRAILLAWAIDAIIPGAPYLILPLAAVLLQRGAGIGAAATLVLSASVVGVTRIPYELAFVSWQFSALRVAGCAVLAPLGGLAVHWLNRLAGFYPIA